MLRGIGWIAALSLAACAGAGPVRGRANEPTIVSGPTGGVGDGPLVVGPDQGAAALWAYFGHMQVRDATAVLPPGVPPTPDVSAQPRRVDNLDDDAARFAEGYLAAGGDGALLAHIENEVIPCESGWSWEWGDPYRSVAQFTPDSWERAGGGDPLDLYQVGGNVARWIAKIGEANAGTRSGWPYCWNVDTKLPR